MNEILLRSDGTVKVMDGKKVLFDGTMDEMMSFSLAHKPTNFSRGIRARWKNPKNIKALGENHEG